MIRMPTLSLLTVNNNKTIKSLEQGWLTVILHLKPYLKLCPFSTEGCREACLNTAGMGRFNTVQNARDRRTKMYQDNFVEFKKLLVYELKQVQLYAEFQGLKLCARLNGTSDIVWERKFPEIFEMFHEVPFYDYTKIPNRVTPSNYSLVFSRSGENDEHCLSELQKGNSVAVVFREMPDTWNGFEVIDGDKNDLRFLDPTGKVVGLKPKGKAKWDKSGFVI